MYGMKSFLKHANFNEVYEEKNFKENWRPINVFSVLIWRILIDILQLGILSP